MSEMKEFLLNAIETAEDERIARMGYIDGILSNLNLPEDTYHDLIREIVEFGDTLYDLGVLDQASNENMVNSILAGMDYDNEQDSSS